MAVHTRVLRPTVMEHLRIYAWLQQANLENPYMERQASEQFIYCFNGRGSSASGTASSRLGRFSLDVRSLGELVDMYHNRDATDRRDKVFALLGMSSDNSIPADLSPDYSVSWKDLFHRLIKFLVGKQASVETWEDKEITVIKSMGYVIGQVASVQSAGEWDDMQSVQVIPENIPGYLSPTKKRTEIRYRGATRKRAMSPHHLDSTEERGSRWALHATAKRIQEGDVVCLLEGASKPTIVRLCRDYCTVVAMSVTPPDDQQIDEESDIGWPDLLRSVTTFPRDFLLIWDWEKAPERPEDGEGHEYLMTRARKHARTELKSFLDKGARLPSIGLILGDLGKYGEAKKKLQKAIMTHEWASREEFLQILTAIDGLALIRESRGDPEEAEKLRVMTDILGRRGNYVEITQDGLIEIAKSFGHEVMTLLFDWRGDEVQISEEV
ncbi:seryl-trna synthetase, partial [Fusarium albosuccineum]